MGYDQTSNLKIFLPTSLWRTICLCRWGILGGYFKSGELFRYMWKWRLEGVGDASCPPFRTYCGNSGKGGQQLQSRHSGSADDNIPRRCFVWKIKFMCGMCVAVDVWGTLLPEIVYGIHQS